MATYDGPAIVITDGAEYEVEASLVLTVESVPVPGHQPMKGLAEWHGTLQAQSDEAAGNIYEAEQPKLRIDGGEHECLFIATGRGSHSIEIRGSGAAPFG
ncbi:hypothetical protein ACFWP5_25285 [Streptomyces sp. NPDC058469]|uniref:hypothetical protein n=1 Tax=Streptomyces sp. NPDC058469 TaxID=3346514 RepID=UPI0036617152